MKGSPAPSLGQLRRDEDDGVRLANLSGVELSLPGDFAQALGRPTLVLDQEGDPWPFDPGKGLDVRHRIVPDLWPLAVPLSTLKLLPGNPRQGDVPAMRRSLHTYGQRKPVVVNVEHGSRPVVEAGNHTMKAAKAEGWTHLAVVRVRDDPDTELGFALADNRIAELGRFDPKLLAEATGKLRAVAPELLLAAGYTGDLPPGQTDPYAEWEAMPEFTAEELSGAHWRFAIALRTDADTRAFLKLLGRRPSKPWPRTFWWPDAGGYGGADPDQERGLFTDEAYIAAEPEAPDVVDG